MEHYVAYIIGFLCGYLAFKTSKEKTKVPKVVVPRIIFEYLIHMNFQYIQFMKAYVSFRDNQDTSGLNKLYRDCKKSLGEIEEAKENIVETKLS